MNLKETLRYLGYRGKEADEQTLRLIRECWEELEEKTERRACFREFPLVFLEDRIDMGCLQTKSRDLRRNLEGCSLVVLFAATLGVMADNLIRRYSRFEMSRAVVMQAASAAMLEDYCDQVNEEIRMEYEKRGMFLRPRFSPGYGDFSLGCQPELLGGLEASKRVGITLTDSYLMMPSKSVTAVIGAGGEKRSAARCPGKGETPGTSKDERDAGKCLECEKMDCLYRRKTI